MNRVRRIRWSDMPRAAATLLALLLSVLAGPRGNADDRRAERLAGAPALVAPINTPAVVQAHVAGIAAPAVRAPARPAAPGVPPTAVRSAARPLCDTPVAARAP